MAQDLVTLFNLALSAVGTKSRVSSPNEESREAEICRRWYETVRNQALSAAPWACARAVGALTAYATRDTSLVWAEGDPEPPWIYQYNLPNDFIYPRHLESYMNFVMTQRDGQPQMLTDDTAPVLTYTKRQEVLSGWDVGLWNSVVYALAGAISLPLHGKPGRAKAMFEQANMAIVEARVNEANRDQNQYESIPDWLMARGVTAGSPYSRYVYQHGPLFSTNALL